MLHLIYQSPLESATLQRIAINDSILFMENALFRLLKSSRHASELETMSTHSSLFVLEEEIALRGIHSNALVAEIKVIDYQDFVHLTLEHSLIQTWN